MKRKITIVLPCLPPSELNPNNLRRTHWKVRSKFSKEARDFAGWTASEARRLGWNKVSGDTPLEKVSITITYFIKGKREIDLDNLLASSKAWIDGLVDAGIMVSDKRSCTLRITIQWKKAELEATHFLIEEME